MKSVKVAYVFLGILVMLLAFCTYIKFSYVEKKEDPNTHLTSVPLSEIEKNYNNRNKEIETTATINGTNLDITYNNNTYSFTFENGILKLNTSDNIEEMFIYLVDAVSMSKNNSENESLITTNLIINSLFSNESIKVVKNATDIMYVIDTNKDISLYKTLNIYKEVKVVNINDKNYDIDMKDIKLISPTIKYDSNTNIFVIKAYIENTTHKKATAVINIYDDQKKKVLSDTKEITGNEKVLETSIKLGDVDQEKVLYCSYEIK